MSEQLNQANREQQHAGPVFLRLDAADAHALMLLAERCTRSKLLQARICRDAVEQREMGIALHVLRVKCRAALGGAHV